MAYKSAVSGLPQRAAASCTTTAATALATHTSQDRQTAAGAAESPQTTVAVSPTASAGRESRHSHAARTPAPALPRLFHILRALFTVGAGGSRSAGRVRLVGHVGRSLCNLADQMPDRQAHSARRAQQYEQGDGAQPSIEPVSGQRGHDHFEGDRRCDAGPAKGPDHDRRVVRWHIVHGLHVWAGVGGLARIGLEAATRAEELQALKSNCRKPLNSRDRTRQTADGPKATRGIEPPWAGSL